MILRDRVATLRAIVINNPREQNMRAIFSNHRLMMNAGPLAGVTGGVAALAMIPDPELKLLGCATLFAMAAGSALRRLFPATPARAQMSLSDYPFAAPAGEPWSRDGGPLGL